MGASGAPSSARSFQLCCGSALERVNPQGVKVVHTHTHAHSLPLFSFVCHHISMSGQPSEGLDTQPSAPCRGDSARGSLSLIRAVSDASSSS